MTAENSPSPRNLQAIKPIVGSTRHPALVGRIGTFCAPDGVEFAGRSVLNVLWHLQSLGFEPLLITRIGNDAEGRQISHYLEKRGINLAGIQIDDSLPTSGRTASSGEREIPSCAWEALDSKSAANVIDSIEPPVLFHGVTATSAGFVQKSLNAIQIRTAVPYFVDLDLGRIQLAADSVRRALLGVKWIRADAEQLPELGSDSQPSKSRSVLEEALKVQARFALEGIVVEHNGLPILGIWPDMVARSSISPPADPTFLPGGRDAATAALIVGLLLGWRGQVMIERAAQFAFLAGAEAIAERVDPFVYSTVLQHWCESESNAVRS
jgi:fructokinase